MQLNRVDIAGQSKTSDLRGMFDLGGLTALVTGGGYGLGRGLVHGLAAHGATVIGLARSEDALAATFADLDPPHRYLVGDLTTDEVYERLDSIDTDIDILVNNAGGDPHTKPWGQQTTEEWRNTYEVNVIAAERLCRLLTPKMVATRLRPGHQRVLRVRVGRPGPTQHRTPGRRRRVHRRQARTDRPHPLPRLPARRQRRHGQHAESGDDHLGREPERADVRRSGPTSPTRRP